MTRRRRTTQTEPPPPASAAAAGPVTLVPTGQAFIPGWPAVETTVEPELAAELLAWQPPAFTVKPPPAAGATAEES